MPKQLLNFEQKHFVVMQLARHRTPSEVARALRAEYSIEFSAQAVQKYDPTTVAGRTLAADWRDLFYRFRVEYETRLAEKARQQA
jgi:hypothetical protein